VLVPGKAAESPLWVRIHNEEMPPENPLPAAERELLKQWIDSGAAWPAAIDRFAYTTDARAGYNWWALQPLASAQPPQVRNTKWVRNDIDRFILAPLEAAGLQPAPEADRRTLIRRLSFDLLGLPPDPAAVAAFEADSRPDAYERLVDHLLQSPHYGERQARHWLDVVRYGESQGFERDKLRPDAWRYRDFVILAFNDDLPYDQFVRLQIAGDVVRPGDPMGIVATGFLVAGPYDEVGQSQQSAAMKGIVRQDEMEDVIAATCQTFLGLTVNCARCHDHKFDPITQVDYYRLAAALAGLKHGVRESLQEERRAQVAGPLRDFDASLAELRGQFEELLAPARKQLEAAAARALATRQPPAPFARWEFDDLKDSAGSLHGEAHGGARVENGRLVLDGQDDYVTTAHLDRDLTAKTFEAWVHLATLDQRGGGVIGVQWPGGATFDALVYGERQPRRWVAGSEFFRRTQDVGSDESAGPDTLIHLAIVYDSDGTITLYRNGRLYGTPYRSNGPQSFAADKAHVVFGLRHHPPGANKMFAGAIDRAALYDRALSAEEIATLAGVAAALDERQVVEQLDRPARRRHDELLLRISQLAARRRLLAGGPTYAIVPEPPQAVQVLARGNPRQPQEEVAPGGLRCVATLSAELGLATSAPEADRRAKLAAWLTDAANPLTTRVIVNRLWQAHFGQGIVETPNDLGFNGGRPSHPELLDYLALQLIARGYSLKALHRLIVTSAAYRQGSRFDPAAARVDAQNRLLWRKEPQRLEAETLRDAMLSVAGQLNVTMGGPGFQDFRTFTNNSQFYIPIDADGWEYQRRTIYRTWVRSGTNPLLDVFDCPDPSTKTPRRAVTTTPLQALSLLNNSFVLRMAEKFAQRVQREAGAHQAAPVAYACELALARPPEADEQAAAAAFIENHGLAAYCRVLFNSNEFLYVD
jgi:hypothetical protein